MKNNKNYNYHKEKEKNPTNGNDIKLINDIKPF